MHPASYSSRGLLPSYTLPFYRLYRAKTTVLTARLQVHHPEQMSQDHLKALRRVLFSQLDTIQGKTLSEDVVESLLLTCGDSMLLAALDLVDSADGMLNVVTPRGFDKVLTSLRSLHSSSEDWPIALPCACVGGLRAQAFTQN